MTLYDLQIKIMEYMGLIDPKLNYNICRDQKFNSIITVQIQNSYFFQIDLDKDYKNELNEFYNFLVKRKLLGENIAKLKGLI